MDRLYCMGPIVAGAARSLQEQAIHMENPPGCVFDLNDATLDETLPLILELRKSLLEWVCYGRSRPGPQIPIVVLCKDEAQRTGVDEWAIRNRGCPGLWFALGMAPLMNHSV